ncbi:hypothetical protein FD733_02480 [Pantoea sp. Eser]|nr:hypothetical protein [Pantoea sp. Eser]
MQQKIARLINAFADQAEWIIFGHCPPALRPLINTVIRETDREIYHKELMKMHPDLAPVPHDGHPLTDAEAYLHLIEYGAGGIPLICSKSVGTGSNTFTTTCVANEYAEWHNAINAHLHDPESSEKMGKILQSEVHQHCLLDEVLQS